MLSVFSFENINLVQNMMFLFKSGDKHPAEAIYSTF